MELREARLDHVHNYLFIAKKDRTFLLSIFNVDLYRVLGNNIYSFVENQMRDARYFEDSVFIGARLALDSLI